jgi:hypothetical protein
MALSAASTEAGPGGGVTRLKTEKGKKSKKREIM